MSFIIVFGFFFGTVAAINIQYFISFQINITFCIYLSINYIIIKKNEHTNCSLSPKNIPQLYIWLLTRHILITLPHDVISIILHILIQHFLQIHINVSMYACFVCIAQVHGIYKHEWYTHLDKCLRLVNISTYGRRHRSSICSSTVITLIHLVLLFANGYYLCYFQSIHCGLLHIFSEVT